MPELPSQPPLVSIVTPSLNMARYLKETIDSVILQDYPRVEHIVIDGGSTDGTLDLLAAHQDRVIYRSSKDKGPADAIHKGFQLAQGDILAWLNADDTLLPGAVKTVVSHFQTHPEVDVLYGRGYWTDDGGRRLGNYPTQPFRAELLERECFICQPAAFMRASAYRRCGLDPDVHPSFDYDLWIRMALENLRFAHIPDYLATSRLHSGGLTIRLRGAVFHSSMDVLQRHFGYVPFPWVFGYVAHRLDGRDQVFEPLQPSLYKYLASLPVGLRLNHRHPFRYLGEWIAAPLNRIRHGSRRSASPIEIDS